MNVQRPAVRHFTEGRGLLTLILAAAVLWSLFSVEWDRDLFHRGGATFVVQAFAALLSLDLSADFLGVVLKASWTTVTYAVAGITLALGIGLPLGVIASGTLNRSASARWSSVVGVRVLLAFMRAIHELIWAWLFVVAIGLSPMTAVLALAIPYGGILGRIFAELLNDVPEEPLRALRSSGASEVQVFLYGRLPAAFADMLGYAFYRFECAIRSAAVFGFVGIAGLGFQLQLSLDELLYDQVWTLLMALVVMVVAVDIWSSQLRRSLWS
jgi:phosphonate transport system permease protein